MEAVDIKRSQLTKEQRGQRECYELFWERPTHGDREVMMLEGRLRTEVLRRARRPSPRRGVSLSGEHRIVILKGP